MWTGAVKQHTPLVQMLCMATVVKKQTHQLLPLNRAGPKHGMLCTAPHIKPAWVPGTLLSRPHEDRTVSAIKPVVQHHNDIML